LVPRAPSEGDVDAIFEYASDPEVTAFMDWRRLSEPGEVLAFLSRTEEGWASGADFTWAITERGVDRVIGAVSIRARACEADFGYVLNRRFWNRGMTTEAAAAVTAWALSTRRLPRIWATCDAQNARSIRVLEKLGLEREGLVPGGMVRPNLSAAPREAYLYGRQAPAA
jgi:RimJ/RimL family protein N-acetyltransferase